MMLLIVGALISLIGLLWFRAIAKPLGLLDVPNSRSQHSRPIVVGGGIAIAIAVVIQVLVLAAQGLGVLKNPDVFAACALALSLIGLADDRFNLPSAPRLMLYGVAVVAVLLVEVVLWPVWLLALLAVAWLWVVNLTNFMDGLDGFLTCQALCVAVGVALLAAIAPIPNPDLSFLALALVAGLVPFLFFNWPPATMFMGDAGAVFTGFYLGALGLLAAAHDPALGAAWLILMMPFIVDATGTLVLRLAQGYPPHIAHRDHAYQRLAAITGSALLVDVGLLGLQGLWQFPLAWWAMVGGYSPIFAVIFSAIPSAVLLAYLRRRE